MAVAEDVGAPLATAESSQDPYPAYRAMRRRARVWSDAIGTWLAGGYDEVRAVLARPDVFRSSGIKGPNVRRLPADVRDPGPLVETIGLTPALVFSDPPVHTLHRLLVNRPLTPRALAPRHEWMHALCDELIERWRRTLEGPTRSATSRSPSPCGWSSNVRRRPRGRRRSTSSPPMRSGVLHGLPSRRGLALATEQVERRFDEHLQRHLDREAREPDGSLLSVLLAPADDEGDDDRRGGDLPDLPLFLTAAFETTAAGIGSAMYGLLTHPDQLGLVRGDASLVPAAFEEGIRWESPIQKLIRLAEADAEIGGVPEVRQATP